MAERRALIDGLKPAKPAVDSTVESDFVYGEKTRGGGSVVPAPATTPIVARSPLSTRIRTDYGKALKRASLDRQLRGIEPSSVCDILEQALEPWLKGNGYLP
jgi:hypothetical protein